MNIFDILNLIGGLCLFLFGMELMGKALERRAGSGLRNLLGKLTQNKLAGFVTGLGVTSVIQSSSATTVMVVGFVNSGLMTLRQAINVIMGANVGTTVTAWILSLGGISSDNLFVQLLKPTSFTPVLALIGTSMFMFGKSSKGKDTATILLGFATLMFGMDAMSSAVSGLRNVPEFQQLFITFYVYPDAGTSYYPHHGNNVNLLYLAGNVGNVNKDILSKNWLYYAKNGHKTGNALHIRIPGSE